MESFEVLFKAFQSLYFEEDMMLFLLSSVALAQSAPGAQPPAYMSLVPIAVIFGVMYFLMIRPQIRKQKQHQEFVGQLKRGDSVITASGIFGTIEGLTDQFVTLEIAQDVRIKILRSQVAAPVSQLNEAKK